MKVNKILHNDNYIWIIENKITNTCIVIDPTNAKKVIDYFLKNKVSLSCILITHHHYDHIEGLPQLVEKYKPPVYGPLNEYIKDVNKPVQEGSEIFATGFDYPISVFDTPGHSIGHISFKIKEHLFCGDVLFSAGCGRVLEGTLEDMYNSIIKLNECADDTLLYCGHEYTLANIKFALEIEPNNIELLEYKKKCEMKIKKGEGTLPTKISLERNINPFLRCNQQEVKNSINKRFNKNNENPLAIFKLLRNWKNVY